MKKLVIILLILIHFIVLFFGCSKTNEENKMIEYNSGIYYNKNWTEVIGTYNGCVISTEQDALNIASAIFNGITNNDYLKNYIPQSVFFDEKDEIWIVTFGLNTTENRLGGDCSIAMNKKDGKVLRIWFGE